MTYTLPHHSYVSREKLHSRLVQLKKQGSFFPQLPEGFFQKQQSISISHIVPSYLLLTLSSR